MTSEDYMRWAVNQLVLRHPWFGIIVLYMTIIPDESIPTACTDGRKIMYSPKYVEQLAKKNPKSVIALLMHEVLHVALKHIYRLGNRDMFIWNIATDIAIDCILADVKDIPAFAPDEVHREHKNRNAEQIYDWLLKNAKHAPGYGNSPDSHELWPNEGNDVDMELAVRQATETAKRQGNLPGSLESLVEAALKPKVDWRDVLRAFVTPVDADYNIYPPDRRFVNPIYDYLYLPDIAEIETVDHLIVGVDTSGSVTDEHLSQFLRELYTITALYPQINMKIITCDAKVQDVFFVSNGDIPPVRFGGRNGTSFVPVFDEIERRQFKPARLVYLTDGWGTFPDDPGYPVLWVINHRDHVEIPFGFTVVMNE